MIGDPMSEKPKETIKPIDAFRNLVEGRGHTLFILQGPKEVKLHITIANGRYGIYHIASESVDLITEKQLRWIAKRVVNYKE